MLCSRARDNFAMSLGLSFHAVNPMLSPCFVSRFKVFAVLSWHAISCGVWKDWAVQHNFLRLDYRTRTITLWDDGNGKFGTLTMQDIALALLRTILDLEKYTNKEVYITDYARSKRELLEAIERISGSNGLSNHSPRRR